MIGKGYIPSPIPFVANFGRTNQRRKACSNLPPYENPVRLTSGLLVLPTMQILTDASPSAVSVFRLVNDAGAIDLATINWETHNTPDGLGCLTYPQAAIIATGVETGPYWLEVGNDDDTFYSQEIYVFADWPGTTECEVPRTFVKLTWATPCPIDNAGHYGTPPYTDLPPYELYIEAEPIHPAHELTDEGENDSDGTFDPTFQRMEKTVSLEFVGADYIFDALAHLPLYPDKTLIFSDGEAVTVTDTEVSANWLENCNARISLKLSVSPLIKKGCGAEC